MDAAITAAILTGLASLIGLFFGRRYWDMLNGLVTSQAKEIERLQTLTRDLRDRLDRLEEQLFERSLQLQETMSSLDNYIVSSQNLLIENQKLRTENAQLKTGRRRPKSDKMGQNLG